MAPFVAELAVQQVTDNIERLRLYGKQDVLSRIPPPTELQASSFVQRGSYAKMAKLMIEHVGPGLRADRDPAKPHLSSGAKLDHLNPYIGTEINGIQISQLSENGLDELALFTANRKGLIFSQDLKDIGPDRQIEHFGHIQRSPTSGNVKGYPEFHVVHHDANSDQLRRFLTGTEDRLVKRGNGTLTWHAHSLACLPVVIQFYETQSSGTIFFFILDQHPNDGDTLFAPKSKPTSGCPPEFQKRHEGLRAVYSAIEHAENSRRHGGPVCHEPIDTEHPVTSEKALYVNPGFVRHIVEFKKESGYPRTFSYDHIRTGADFQMRARYKPGTVVVRDNCVTVHSALTDFDPEERRHAVKAHAAS